MSNDTLRRLAVARPDRLDPGPVNVDAQAHSLMAHARVPRRPWFKVPRVRLALGTGLVAAVALVLALVAGVSLVGPSGKPAIVGAADARQILLTAAEHTAAQQVPTSGRYWVVRKEGGALEEKTLKGQHFNVLMHFVEEYWTAQDPRQTSYYVYHELAAKPASAKDAAIAKRVGYTSKDSPRHVAEQPTFQGAWNDPATGKPTLTDAQLRAFPTDTAGLKAILNKLVKSVSSKPPTQEDYLSTGFAMLRLPIISNAARAGIYRMLVGMPGVRSLGTVTDVKGRRAQALAFTVHPIGGGTAEFRELIDPKTGASLGTEMRTITPGKGAASARPKTLFVYDLTISNGFENDPPAGS